MMKKQKQKRRFDDDNLDAFSKIRKPLPKPSRAMQSKDTYNRKDRSWMKDLDREED